jgi:hypothetical protein
MQPWVALTKELGRRCASGHDERGTTALTREMHAGVESGGGRRRRKLRQPPILTSQTTISRGCILIQGLESTLALSHDCIPVAAIFGKREEKTCTLLSQLWSPQNFLSKFYHNLKCKMEIRSPDPFLFRWI